MFSNLLKLVGQVVFDPHRVVELQEADLAGRKALGRDDLLALYASPSSDQYEIVLKDGNRLLGIFRSSDGEAAQALFLQLQEKLPTLLTLVPDLTTAHVALQRAVQGVRENPAWPPAHLLAHLGYTECFRTQAMRRHLNQPCGDSLVTPLHIAVKGQKKAMVVALLEQGAPLSAKDVDGNTPLHYAAMAPQEDTELLELLATAEGCDVDVVGAGGESALHVAVRLERLPSAILLLSHAAHTHPRDARGDTPLHIAIKKGNLPLVHALVVFGAELGAENKAGETPRHLAATSRHSIAGELLYALHVVGAGRCTRPSHACNEGCSPHGHFNGLPPENCNFFKASETLLEELLGSQGVQTPQSAGGLRVLCLDGGGVKGLLSIQMLGEVERALGKPLLPGCFDLLAGTSTGGILALALAMGKSVAECRRLYFRLKDKVFVGMRPYDTDNFESFLKTELGENTRMADIQHPMVMVTATRGDRYPADLHLFRNYPSPLEILGVEERDPLTNEPMPPSLGELVWKVARATGAAPTYFRPSEHFIDGGLIANNPTLDAITEILQRNQALTAKGLAEEKCSVVVSVGTGRPPLSQATPLDLSFPFNVVDAYRMLSEASNLVRLLVDQASQTDGRVTSRARAVCRATNVSYFRLNPQLSQDVALDETCHETLLRALWETTAYVRSCLGAELLQLAQELLGAADRRMNAS